MAENDSKRFCECGCGEEILWVPNPKHLNRPIPRFISGHNCRVMKTKRPDPPPPNPSGLCMCGCNNAVPRAAKTGRGNVAGEFVRYLQGHAEIWMTRRNPISPDDPRGPNPSGLCLCGCGAQVPIADRHNPITGNVSGCYVKFLRGHIHWKNRPADVTERTGICACGCGKTTPIAKRSARGNIRGLPMLYVDQSHAQRKKYVEDKITGCWNLQACGPCGYTRIRRGPKLIMGHVWFWEQANGPLAEGMELDHLCRNRSCVNPLHLEPVDHIENCRRIAESENIPNWKDLKYSVNPESGCWIAESNQRHEYVWVRARGRLVWAHRLFYCRAKHIWLKSGEELDHLCSQPRCINPEHMEIVDHQENMRRAAARRKAAAVSA